MKNLRRISIILLLSCANCSLSIAQEISIKLKDSTFGIIQIDSANWNEAWIEVDGGLTFVNPLDTEEVVVSFDGRKASVLSVDSIGSKYRSKLALSIVLDNSGSMFHGYDSLTKYCDSLIDSLCPGAKFQAITFDNNYRSATHRATHRSNVFVAQTRFTDSVQRIKSFWHFFDSIRTQFTPLYDAMVVALQNIEDRRMKFLDSLADVLLVVTDGADNASRTSLETLRDLIDALHIRMYAINYRTADDRLQWLTNHAKGNFFVLGSLPELKDMIRYLRTIISRQYHIRYSFPSLGPSGSPRAVPGAAPRTKGR